MVEVVPAILTNNEETFRERLRKAKRCAKRVQIDVADGRFVKNKTLGLNFFRKEKLPKNVEFHLMLREPEKVAGEYAKLGDTVIFHIEATQRPLEVIKKIKKQNKKAGIALGIKTPVSKVAPYLGRIDLVVPMAINPGFSGARFNPSVLAKIRKIRKLNKKVKIEVDGGMMVGTVRKVVKAGADSVAAASAIFGERDIRKAIDDLKKDAERQ